MKAQRITLILRLCAGLGISGFGIVSGIALWIDGHGEKGFATAVIWTLLGCILAPLAEDVEDFLRRASQSED